MLEFGLLGPVRAVQDGRDLRLGGPKQRAVLALLVVQAGQVMPADYLVEVLWRGRPPPGAAGTLRSYVSRLRSLLGPEAVLVGRRGGYVITVQAGSVDAAQFERLVDAGRDALGRGEAVAAAARFGEALALWHGRALADVTAVEPLALEAARLEELRLVAVEGRAEAELELGLAAEVTGELEQLVAEHPVRERLWRLLVLALYRGERQADALAACRRARQMLAEELGLEPGEELRRLEEAVLRHEVPAPVPRQVSHNLPVPLTGLLGRERELAALGELLGQARLVTLTGAGGAGKTRLALEVAAGALVRFPDGVWLADLAGITEPGLVPSLVMAALAVRQSGDMPVIEALRFRLRPAGLLLVLDNCEHLLGGCAELAAALLTSSPGLRVLATSREPLGVPGEVVYEVPPLAVPPDLASDEELAGAAAVQLFLERASAARAGGQATAAPLKVVARICRKLDGLPLAIELAAARASVLSVEEVDSRLADRFGFLTSRRPVAGRRHQALYAAIDWSYELLSAPDARVFRQLSVFAGGFGLEAVAATCCGGNETAALDVLDRLAAKSLVVAESDAGGTRFRLLETIRQYAAARLAEAGEDGQARQRHARMFLGLAEQEHELAVLTRDQDNLRAALDWSLAYERETGLRLARALGDFWLAYGFLHEARDWLERAVAVGPADEWLRADVLRLLGAVQYQAGDLTQAQATLAEAARAAAASGARTVQARITVLVAEIGAIQGEPLEEKLAGCEAAVALHEAEGDLASLGGAWLAVGILRVLLGDAPAGARALERAAACARQSGNRHEENEATGWLLVSFHALPVPASEAIGRAEQLLKTAAGDSWTEAAILQPLALLYGFAGRFADARAAIARSQAMFTRAGSALNWGICAMLAGHIELIAGNPAGAERALTEGRAALQQREASGYLSGILALLAEAVYAQGRLDEAVQLTEQTKATAGISDLDAQARWRATRGKILAAQGQSAVARQLAAEAVALVADSSYASLLAETLAASAEVSRLAGSPDEAEASLRQALWIYRDRGAIPLANRTQAALDNLATRPPATGPA